jgi:hypothetical protein
MKAGGGKPPEATPMGEGDPRQFLPERDKSFYCARLPDPFDAVL